jgi:hypothetical protein
VVWVGVSQSLTQSTKAIGHGQTNQANEPDVRRQKIHRDRSAQLKINQTHWLSANVVPNDNLTIVKGLQKEALKCKNIQSGYLGHWCYLSLLFLIQSDG